MDELQYFQTTEAPGRRMGVGRFVASGSILLLAAAGTGLVCVLMLRMLSQASARDLFAAVWFTFLAGLATVVLGALGVSMLRRRRWARPLTLAVCWPWLGCGSILAMAFVLVIGREWIMFSYRQPGMQELMMMAASLGTVVTVAVLLPLTNILLLRAERVQQALNDHDLNSRWTDTWPLARLALLVSSTSLTLTLASICFNTDTQWPEVYPIKWLSLVVAALLGGIGCGILPFWRAAGWWLSFATTGITLAVLIACTQWMVGDRWGFENGVFWTMLFLPLIGLLVLHAVQFPHRRARIMSANYSEQATIGSSSLP